MGGNPLPNGDCERHVGVMRRLVDPIDERRPLGGPQTGWSMARGAGRLVGALTGSDVGDWCGSLNLAAAAAQKRADRGSTRNEQNGEVCLEEATHPQQLCRRHVVRVTQLVPRTSWSQSRPGDRAQRYCGLMLKLIEFPADEPERARRFWTGVLTVPVEARSPEDGQGWQAQMGGVTLGVHERGVGPGDRFSLPYFAVADLPQTLTRVVEFGGEVIHPGERWAVCRDSEGSPFGLTQASSGPAEQVPRDER